MAFLIHSVDDNRPLGWEYLPCSAIQPKVGMAMALSNGKLVLATGTVAPTYISMMEARDDLEEDTIIPVVRVHGDIVWETEFSAAATAINVGNKVTIGADALTVTATTTSGVAEVVYKDGNPSGSMCRVRFS